ncbi:RNA polymerase sigma factor [Piscinibacter sp. HJYY11]|uniref:RNA polymerase sigma factor n=1 Tax=Piscinibacter sp. HJYY11 TaxID=2801333 RepID=UPI00191D92D6|nr:RNA polymerase sigma factor [Piscinibacter sp. HJYY11]MBL0726136.1 RNA polymerase sigma factor [Piscinibacter sp. HJYY11]
MICNWRSAFARVRSALMRRGRSEQDAEDLVQEAWVRLACYEQEVIEPEAFLMRAALNLSLDAHRVARNRGEQLVVDEVVLIDGSPGTEDIVLARERMVRLSECLGQLPPRTREIFLAHRVDGLRYQDIARHHGVSVSAVEKHIAKATLLLTSGMEGW